MNLRFILFLFLPVFFVACEPHYSRIPASDFSVTSAVIQDAFDIPSLGATLAEAPAWSSLRASFESRMRSIEGVAGSNNMVVELVNGPLPEGVSARLVSDIQSDGKFVLKIIHANDDAGARALLEQLSKSLTSDHVLQTYYDFFEWSYNMRAGDERALSSFHALKLEALGKIDQGASAKYSAVLSDYETRMQDFETLDSVVKKDRNLAQKARKSVLSELDKAGETDQLKRLVAAGKREEVADLIDRYLPKEQMAPFERDFWNQMLEVIRHPLPLKDRTLVFRGINDDMVYGALSDAGKELSKEDAVATSQAFMMSSMMTKNQGTWNRRLRSLETMNDKFLGQNNVTKSSRWSENFRISTFFKQHSRNPQGSPFLSFTPKISVAQQFGSKRTAAYLVDPRALLANTTTGYVGEFEFLTTLVTFPDELVDIYDSELHGNMDAEARKTRFLEKTRAKMVSEYGEADGDAAYGKIKTVFDRFNDFNDVAGLEANVKKEGFFSKVASWIKKKPKVEVPVNDPASNSCTYILKFLWNL